MLVHQRVNPFRRPAGNSPGYTASRWTLSCSRWAAAARCSRCSRSSLAALWAASARGDDGDDDEPVWRDRLMQASNLQWILSKKGNIQYTVLQNVGSANSHDSFPSNIGHPWSSMVRLGLGSLGIPARRACFVGTCCQPSSATCQEAKPSNHPTGSHWMLCIVCMATFLHRPARSDLPHLTGHGSDLFFSVWISIHRLGHLNNDSTTRRPDTSTKAVHHH